MAQEATCILVSHDRKFIRTIATRHLLIDKGRLVENDGDLGSGLIKKRVAREGKGKRGGFRTIIIYSKGKRSFFVYGFPKNAKDNLDDGELEKFKKLAKLYLSFSDTQIVKALDEKELEEVTDHEEEIQK